jgi:hypothetical protein
MPDAFGLFTKGLKWSYRKYGLKGAAVFVLLGLVAYYLINEKLEELLDGRETEGTEEPA